MPKYVITAPDGSRYEVTAPDGASEQDVLAYFQSQHQKPSVSPEAAAMARQGMGPLEAGVVGAGRTVDQWGQGIKQGGLHISNLISPSPEKTRQIAAMGQEQEANTQAYAGLQREFPFATAFGETAPYAALPPSVGPAMSAGVVGGLEALKYGSPEQRLTRGLFGAGTAAAGSAVGRGVADLVNPVSPGINQTQRAALKDAMDMGVQPRRSQITGGAYARAMEDFAAQTPGGMGRMQRFEEGNRRALNLGASRTIGENADELTPYVFDDAYTRMGDVFERIKSLGKVNVGGRSVNPIEIDKNVGLVADDIIKSQLKGGKEFSDPRLLRIAEEAKRLSGMKGRIDGEAYQLMRSNLSEASWDLAEGATSSAAQGYRKLLAALDDSAERSLNSIGQAGLAGDLKAVRPQYANFKTLTRGKVVDKGNVNPQALAQAMRARDPTELRTGGGGDLGKIARYGEAHPPLVGGSQTYMRQTASNPVMTAMKAPLAFLAAHLTTNPMALFYAKNVGGTKGAQLAAQLANPAARAGTIGAGELTRQALFPVMTKQ